MPKVEKQHVCNANPMLAGVVQLALRALRRTIPVATLTPSQIFQGSRSTIVRCLLVETSGRSRSVIVKQNREEPSAGYSELASLRFLSKMPATANFVPRFLAGDASARLYVMEEVHYSRSVEDVLNGSSSAEAGRVLDRLAVSYGELVAATAGQEANFAKLRSALPVHSEVGRHVEASRLRDNYCKIEGWLSAAKVRTPRKLRRSVERVAEWFADPGHFVAFTHGDPAPGNGVLTGDEVTLLDFEFGGYRSALYDISGWYVLCPLPQGIWEQMRSTFWTTVEQSAPGFGCRIRLAGEWGMICAFRALSMLTWISCDAIKEDRAWGGRSARDGALLAASRLWSGLEGIEELGCLASVGEKLEASLRRQWPEVQNPAEIWPALANQQGRES